MEVSKKIIILFLTGLMAIAGIIIAVWYMTRDVSKTSSSNQPANTDQIVNQDQTVNTDQTVNQEQPASTDQDMIIFPQNENNYFKEFLKAYNKIFLNNPNYVYGIKSIAPIDSTTPEGKTQEKYNKIRKELVPILQIINYNKIFDHASKSTDLKLKEAVSRSKNEIIKNIDRKIMQTLKEDERVSLIEEILTDKEISKIFVITDRDIKELKNFNISNFKFDHLPNIFGIFSSLNTIFLDNTGISDLEPLNSAKNLVIISSDDNKVSRIDGLADLTLLKCLYLYNNPITEIDDKFLKNHERMNMFDLGGIYFKLPIDSDDFKEFVYESTDCGGGFKYVVLKNPPVVSES